MNCIETSNLTHRFASREIILDNINLQVPRGAIYGFLGPNGAGKTTTLKLLLGLLKRQEGSITVFNKQLEKERTTILKEVGSLIESPSLYAYLTAAENLKIWQKIYQCPQSRIDEVLEITGLAKTGSKKTRHFSLGMKQRLSIAVALLHKPELLILDEPTNGLDPAGILEVRELLIRINREQKTTILISSHLLSEIEKLVTHIGIINKGQLLFQGTLDELHQKQSQAAYVGFETSHAEKAMALMRTLDLNPELVSGQAVIPAVDKELIARVNALLVNNQVDVYQISTLKKDLESLFMDLTKNKA